MPFELMILYHWKPDIAPERIEQHLNRIRKLPGRVPNLLRVSVGPRTLGFGAGSEHFTHAGIMTFRHQSDFEAFGTTPAHDEIAPELVADLQNLLAVGLETQAIPS